MRKLGLAALGLMLAGAVAGGSTTSAQARNWNGLWVGAFAGGMWVDKNADLVDHSPGLQGGIDNSSVPLDVNLDGSGFVGGAELGFNLLQNGGLVLGIVMDISSGVDGSTVVDMPGGGGFVSTQTTASFDMNWFATLRARAGMLVGPAQDLLVFVTGGLAVADIDYDMTLIGNPSSTGNFAGSASKREAGWTLGGGFEYALGANWSVEAEALYFDLGSEKVTLTDANQYPADYVTYEFNNTGYTVRVGVKYLFGRREAELQPLK